MLPSQREHTLSIACDRECAPRPTPRPRSPSYPSGARALVASSSWLWCASPPWFFLRAAWRVVRSSSLRGSRPAHGSHMSSSSVSRALLPPCSVLGGSRLGNSFTRSFQSSFVRLWAHLSSGLHPLHRELVLLRLVVFYLVPGLAGCCSVVVERSRLP